MVRISEGNLSKGLVFGVPDVAKREIIWLEMKAAAQNLTIVEKAEDADEAYTYEWALNPAEVTKLLLLNNKTTK